MGCEGGVGRKGAVCLDPNITIWGYIQLERAAILGEGPIKLGSKMDETHGLGEGEVTETIQGKYGKLPHDVVAQSL